MKTPQKVRCQYTPEGVKTFGKQRLGYVVGEGRDGGKIVRWDNQKSTSKYAESFIDTSPLIALYSDDEIEQALKEQEPEITPQAILSIERNLEYIKNTGLSQVAIVVLLQDYIGQGKITKKQIKAVLEAMPRLKSEYIIN